MGKSGISEFDIIRWIRSVTPTAKGVLVGIGDDCAALRLKSTRCLLKIDQLIEGLHFDCAKATPDQIGRKAVARPLSDIAAMVGTPRAIVVSVLLRPSFRPNDIRRMYRGMQRMAEEFGAAIVGGDIAIGGERLAISVSVLGESNRRGDVLRSGAKVDDAIFVTGDLGGSILGKHLDFTPRIREAQELARKLPLHAMIDVSDGLAADLGHILEESRVGGVIRAKSLPISDAAARLAKKTGRPLLDHVLNDGEDYELIFTVSARAAARVPKRLSSGVRVTRIGEVIARAGLWLENKGGRKPIEPKGWEYRI
jgi:thiamine-monophosphate kinase